MVMSWRVGFAVMLALFLTGCGSLGTETLMFVQSDKIGIGAGAGTSNQGVRAHMGYDGFNAASVPVVTRDANGAAFGYGTAVPLGGVLTPGADSGGTTDAYSVLGQFDAQTSGNNRIQLGKFFTTGFASRTMSDGYVAGLPKTKQ